MLDTDLNIEVFYERMPERLFALNRVRLELNKLWTDRHQVSAYINMRRVIQLLKQKFGRNSLDGKGMRVKVITHNNYFTNDDGTIMKDNAMWSNSNEVIAIGDPEDEAYAHSYAAALDIIAHESTHAVLHYGIGDEFSTNGNTVAKAINEAYADIFACIMTEDESWKMGEDVFNENSSFNCIRDIANPTSTNAKGKFHDVGTTQDEWLKEWESLKGALDNSDHIYEEHRFSHYISHAAYLMYKNGLSWEELRKLWYQTIHENVYTPFPKFSDVRREVVRVAKTTPSLKSKIAIIEKAFDEVGIYEPVILKGKVVNATTYEPLSGAVINVYTLSETSGRLVNYIETDTNGNFSLQLGKTKYNIQGEYTFEGEENFVNFTLQIELSGDKTIKIVLARDGTVSFDNIPDVPTPTSPDIPVPVISGDIPIDEEHFPDENFRSYIRNNIDSDDDGILSEAEIKNTTNMSVSHRNIHSLRGIEYFVVLQKLWCNGNPIFTLDLSNNITLQYLYCLDCYLEVLNISGCTAIQYLNCSRNQLTSLDVSTNTALEELYCDYNQLTTLDVHGCIALQRLACDRNQQLTNLNVSGCVSLQGLSCMYSQLNAIKTSGCIALQWLYCNNNQLTKLDVSECSALTDLDCYSNQLTELDVSGCSALRTLDCRFNQLTELDVSHNTALTALWCSSNQLTILDLSNCLDPEVDAYYDSGVTVIWPSITTPSASTINSYQSSSLKSDSASTLLAVLPKFTPTETASYTFTVSLDREIPEGSTLLLLEGSEDLNGSFALTDEADTVRLSADFTAGRTYAPVIVATSECENQSGGCNAGIAGIILLAGIIIVLSKIGHVREMRGRE